MPRDVELVLLKQLSSCLAIPMMMVGPEGDLLFFNEPAEPLVGLRFEESGELSLDEWGRLLQLTDETGRPLSDDDRPIVAALNRHEPAHRRLFIRGQDGERQELRGTAFPLVGEKGETLGVLGLFWRPDGGDQLHPKPAASGSSGQYEVEAILMRRLASYLATPIYLVGAEGELLYFNKAAERILGRRFDEMLESSRGELYQAFRPTGVDGALLKPEEHPLTIARERNQPAHLRFKVHGLDGVVRTIEATAFPLIGQSGRNLGAVGVFWEIEGA